MHAFTENGKFIAALLYIFNISYPPATALYKKYHISKNDSLPSKNLG